MAVWPHTALETELSATISAFQATLDALSDAQPAPRHFAVAFDLANGNRQAALLATDNLALCRMEMDAFAAAGIRAVQLNISCPMLDASFTNYALYRAFYQTLTDEIKARGFYLAIECNFFSNAVGSYDYSGETTTTLLTKLKAQQEYVATNYQPDWLSLMTEPTTQASETGKAFTFAELTTHVVATLASIDRSVTRMCAGPGSWESQTWTEAFLTMPIDGLALNIYPPRSTATNFYTQAALYADMAARAGKQTLILQTSLYKESAAEVDAGNLGAETLFLRDVYDDFADLDLAYLQMLEAFCRKKRVHFCSFFWPSSLYGYLPYTDTTAAYTYTQARAALSVVALANLAARTPHASGTYWGSTAAAQARATARRRTADASRLTR